MQTTDTKLFELFAEYAIASTFCQSETITKSILQDINTGNSNDWGIDSFLIIVNGSIVTSVEEVDDLYRSNRYIEAQFVLIQAKTSTSIDTGEFSKILDGCRYVFEGLDNPAIRPKCNDEIAGFCAIVEKIYQYSANFKDKKLPKLDVFYAYCGKYQLIDEVEKSIVLSQQALSRLVMLDKIEYHIIGENEVSELYKQSVDVLNAELLIGNNRIILPEVDGVSEGYICMIPFTEFKKLIIDDKGNIIKSAFEDNIRDFQGDNLVNRSMSDSIVKGDIALFTMMNNGITVIAKTIDVCGLKVRLNDYQIVNGCQTSHVLYKHAQLDGIDDLRLIVKLIGSEDKEIIDKIIVGNNSQTEVKREQLISLQNGQKQIEEYYRAQNKFPKLYYERRSKQYFGDSNVLPSKIITIAKQIQSFIAMILDEPHKVRGYYGKLISDFNEQDKSLIDTEMYHPSLYYTSGLAWYKIIHLFETGKLVKQFKTVKFHLLYAFKLLIQPSARPQGVSKVEKYSDKLCIALSDDTVCEQTFCEAAKIIENILGRKPIYADASSKELTSKIKDVIMRAKHQCPDGNRTAVSDAVVDGSKSNIHVNVVGKVDLEKLAQTSRQYFKKKIR
jgi:hypothetical protein